MMLIEIVKRKIVCPQRAGRGTAAYRRLNIVTFLGMTARSQRTLQSRARTISHRRELYR
jgi:hypothetical protein